MHVPLGPYAVFANQHNALQYLLHGWFMLTECFNVLKHKHCLFLQICVMDSRAYAALTPGLETADELDACTLLVNSQVETLCTWHAQCIL